MNFAQPPSTTANSPIPGPFPVVGHMTTTSLQPLTVNQTGLMSRPCQQSAPVVSDVINQSHTSTTDFDKSSVKVRSPVELPTSAATVEQVPSPFQPVVIVRQFQKPKPYSRQTSHKSFREHFERAWTTNVEKMQNLALALEGPALECLREVKEDEYEAHEKIWRILARRFGHLDEPERAMSKFDARKQLDGETIAEYEQALRTLYREAWPKADEESKDSALKRKFEEGLSSPDMMQFLRLHARADDFHQTMAKARRFAEAQEAARPKKSVRIVESIDKDHGAESTVPGQPNLQPLLDGFQKVIQTVLERPPAMATVAATGDEASSSTRNGKSSGVSCFQNSRSEQQRPQQSGNGGRRAWNNRHGSSSRSRDSTPERGRQNNGGNNRAQGEESPSPGRGDGNQGYGPRRDFDRRGQGQSGFRDFRPRSNFDDSYRSYGSRGQYQGQRPYFGRNGPPWSYQNNQGPPRSYQRNQEPPRSYQDYQGLPRLYQNSQGPPRSYRPWYDRDQRPWNAPRNAKAEPPNSANVHEQRSYDQRSNSDRTITPPPSWKRGHCSKCGEPGCHSDLHRGIPRNPYRGCYVCGERGCHSFFHRGQGRGFQGQGPPQSSRGSENGPRGPREGDRFPPSNQSSPPSQSASA